MLIVLVTAVSLLTRRAADFRIPWPLTVLAGTGSGRRSWGPDIDHRFLGYPQQPGFVA
jgi:hypothetical protein